MLTEAQLIERLRKLTEGRHGRAEFCARHGFHVSFISCVLAGKEPVTARLANAMGFAMRPAFFPVREIA